MRPNRRDSVLECASPPALWDTPVVAIGPREKIAPERAVKCQKYRSDPGRLTDEERFRDQPLNKDTAVKTRLLLTLALLLWGAIASQAVTLVQAPRNSAIIGDWVGVSDYGDFLRLELNKNGEGLLSWDIAGIQRQIDIYRVRDWSLTTQPPWGIKMRLEPLTPRAEKFEFERIVQINERELKLEFGAGDWVRTATLYNERLFRTMSDSSKQAIKAAKRKKR